MNAWITDVYLPAGGLLVACTLAIMVTGVRLWREAKWLGRGAIAGAFAGALFFSAATIMGLLLAAARPVSYPPDLAVTAVALLGISGQLGLISLAGVVVGAAVGWVASALSKRG